MPNPPHGYFREEAWRTSPSPRPSSHQLSAEKMRPRPLGVLRTSSLMMKLTQTESESDWHLDLQAWQRANGTRRA